MTATALLKLAALNRIRTLAVPGEPLKFSKNDVDRLSKPQEKGD
jgi:hypothetical protein